MNNFEIKYPAPTEIIDYTTKRYDELALLQRDYLISKLIALELDMKVANSAIEYINKKYGENIEL